MIMTKYKVDTITVSVPDVFEILNIIGCYQDFLETLVEETEWDELNKQVMMFRIDNITDVLEHKLEEFKEEC